MESQGFDVSQPSNFAVACRLQDHSRYSLLLERGGCSSKQVKIHLRRLYYWVLFNIINFFNYYRSTFIIFRLLMDHNIYILKLPPLN